MNNILLNQIGFLNKGIKEVTFRNGAISDSFVIVDDKSNEKVAEFKQSEPFENESSGEKCSRGDFSAFDKTGTYRVVSGTDTSYPFKIGNDVYDDLIRDLTYMLHLQRCGCELTEKEAGEFAHLSCHDTPARVYGTDEFIDVSGGWHDAGDYGRYIVPGAKTITDILLAYIIQPEKMSFSMGLNSEGLPDALEEMKYEIDWMLKMQRSDGAVYHKVTCASFPEMDVFPEEEREELIVCPISNASAACFAATMAIAYKVYGKFDKEYAGRLLEAGKRAFDYLDNNAEDEGFHNPSDIHTGEYGDDDWKDEYLWAAGALFYADGGDRYKEVAEKLYETELSGGFGWEDTGLYGGYLYINSEKADPVIRSKMIERMEAYADRALALAENDAYGCGIPVEKFVWGSNSLVANLAMLFLVMNDLDEIKADKKERYLHMAQRQVNYLLGQNGTDYCFVTGFGSNGSKKPHHRPSVKKQKAMKGMLVGGPDRYMQDPVVEENRSGCAPALCYIDEWGSYSTNEITIYWNTPLIYALVRMAGDTV